MKTFVVTHVLKVRGQCWRIIFFYFKKIKRDRTYLFGGQGFLLSCVPLNLEVAIWFGVSATMLLTASPLFLEPEF